jgi:GGDEF domain-containing protein
MTRPEPPEGSPASQPADRHDRFPPPSTGGWCSDARDDPITGLIAWPGFFAQLPGLVEQSLTAGRAVGLAIGDVDNLKDYVEGVRAVDAQSFGHLAGNALMCRLGTIARHWLWTDGPAIACLATFGGDEIVLLAETDSQAAFLEQVAGLRDHLCRVLPRTVSFGAAVVMPDAAPELVSGDHWWREFVVYAIGAVEHCLFEGKHARRRGCGHDLGFVASTQVDGRRVRRRSVEPLST